MIRWHENNEWWFLGKSVYFWPPQPRNNKDSNNLCHKIHHLPLEINLLFAKAQKVSGFLVTTASHVQTTNHKKVSQRTARFIFALFLIIVAAFAKTQKIIASSFTKAQKTARTWFVDFVGNGHVVGDLVHSIVCVDGVCRRIVPFTKP